MQKTVAPNSDKKDVKHTVWSTVLHCFTMLYTVCALIVLKHCFALFLYCFTSCWLHSFVRGDIPSKECMHCLHCARIVHALHAVHALHGVHAWHVLHALNAFHALHALHARFRDHTNRIFQKHGMQRVGYWTPTDEALKNNTLVYILAYKDKAAHEESWAGFRNDPD